MDTPYYVKTKRVPNGPDVMPSTRVQIFEKHAGGERQIGEYLRTHGALYHTFHPFLQADRWFALYSANYTTTEVMELPGCQRIAGEESNPNGFCPVDFYVPFEQQAVIAAGTAGSFGFVSGCIWGDDTSWKIQYLDLSAITQGRIERLERFGYLPLSHLAVRLKDCVSFSPAYPHKAFSVGIQVQQHFELATGKPVDPLDL